MRLNLWFGSGFAGAMTLREADLYPPLKALFEAQGYIVKGEVGAADLVAMRGDDAPVIVEIKRGFALTLYHQAIARQAVTDNVYIAVPRPRGAQTRRTLRENLALCRRLGLGLITVDAAGRAELRCSPAPYKPRKSKAKAARLRATFDRLRGDPNAGGATRHGLVTGYRQDALACARHLAEHGPSRGADVARSSGVATATRIMADNHYGWFRRVARGTYALSPEGHTGLADWAHSDGSD